MGKKGIFSVSIFDDVYEGFVYFVMRRYCYAGRSDIAIFPTLEELAKKCCCSKNTVIRGMGQLLAKKIVLKMKKEAMIASAFST